MSLLKGIVFIPREKKVEVESVTIAKNADKKRRSVDHAKRKKEEKHKKHKKDRHRKPSLEEQGTFDDSSDEDECDYKDFSKYDDEIKLVEQQEILMVGTENNRGDTRDTICSRSETKIGISLCRLSSSSSLKQLKSTFSILTESLTAKEPEHYNTLDVFNKKDVESSRSSAQVAENQMAVGSRYRHTTASSEGYFSDSAENYTSESKAAEQFPESVVPNISVGRTLEIQLPSNQSAAEFFRAKLKKTKGSLKSENIVELDGPMAESNGILCKDEPSVRNQMINRLRNTENKKNGAHRSIKEAVPKDRSLNNSDLNDLIKYEKFGNNNMDENFRENVLRLGKNYKGTELGSSGAFGNGHLTGADEEEDIDMKLFENKHEIQDKILSKKQIFKNISEAKKDCSTDRERIDDKHREVMNRCQHCKGSEAYKAHLTISRGEHTMLRLKTGSHSLGQGHCIITPMGHTSSFQKCEEEVDIEVSRYKSCLRRMYEKNGQAVLFLESALRFGRHPHAVIDVVPVPLGIESEARMCFREVISFPSSLSIFFCTFLPSSNPLSRSSPSQHLRCFP